MLGKAETTTKTQTESPSTPKNSIYYIYIYIYIYIHTINQYSPQITSSLMTHVINQLLHFECQIKGHMTVVLITTTTTTTNTKPTSQCLCHSNVVHVGTGH